MEQTISQTAFIAITPGEPAGIGPDICLQLAQAYIKNKFSVFNTATPVFIADQNLILERAALLQIDIPIKPIADYDPEQRAMWIATIPLAKSVQCGVLDSANGAYVLACMDKAIDGCIKHEYMALVTGPVQKSIINDAGISFSGHTEYLAEKCQQDTVVMMLASSKLKVALATTHLALSEVPAAINKQRLETTIRILQHDLQQKI